MPRVPTYQGPAVRPELYRPAYQQPIDVSSGAQRLAAVVGQAGDRLFERELEAEVNEADATLARQWLEWDAAKRSDASLRGANAEAYRAEAEKWWAEAKQKYGGTLSPAAKAALGKALARRQETALRGVYSYVEREKEAHADQQAAAAADTAVRFAVSTGDLVGGASRVREIIAQTGVRKGWTTEMVQAEQARALGQMHVAWVQTLASRDPAAARKYFSEHQHEVPVTQQDDLDRVVREAERRANVQQFIGQVAGLPYEEQIKKLGEIKDPEEQRLARIAVNEQQALKVAAQREREKAASDRVWQAVTSGKRPDPADLAAMDGRERAQLLDWQESRARRLAGGQPVKTDWPTYIEVRQKLAAGEKVDLRLYTEKLAGPQIEQLLDLQGKPQHEVATITQQINAASDALGLRGENAGLFASAAQDALAEAQRRNGKPLTFEERRQVLEALSREVVLKKTWFWNTMGPAYKLPREERLNQVLGSSAQGGQLVVGQVYFDSGGRRAVYRGVDSSGKAIWEPLK